MRTPRMIALDMLKLRTEASALRRQGHEFAQDFPELERNYLIMAEHIDQLIALLRIQINHRHDDRTVEVAR